MSALADALRSMSGSSYYYDKEGRLVQRPSGQEGSKQYGSRADVDAVEPSFFQADDLIGLPFKPAIMIGKRGLSKLGVDPVKDLVGQYTGLWDKKIRAELADQGAKLKKPASEIDDPRAYYQKKVRELEQQKNMVAMAHKSGEMPKDEAWRIFDDLTEQQDAFQAQADAFYTHGAGRANLYNEDFAWDEAIEGSQLAKAYDDLPSTSRTSNMPFEGSGSYNDRTRHIESSVLSDNEIDTVMHEGQHFVQDVEGFARGGSPALFSLDEYNQKSKALDEITAPLYDYRHVVDEIDKAGGDVLKLIDVRSKFPYEYEAISGALRNLKASNIDEAFSKSRRIQSELDKLTPMSQYERLAGEWEARNVGARATLPKGTTELGQALRSHGADFLTGKPFSMADDIPLEDLIIKDAYPPDILK